MTNFGVFLLAPSLYLYFNCFTFIIMFFMAIIMIVMINCWFVFFFQTLYFILLKACILQMVFQTISLHICYDLELTNNNKQEIFFYLFCRIFNCYTLLAIVSIYIYVYIYTMYIYTKQKPNLNKQIKFVSPHLSASSPSNILEQWDYLNSRQIEHLLIT